MLISSNCGSSIAQDSGPCTVFFHLRMPLVLTIKIAADKSVCGDVVGVWRFELQASWSRTKRATICAIPRKKTAADCCRSWLRKKDSNPHNTSQSRRCYHYTIPQRPQMSTLLLYEEGRALSTPFSEKFLCQKAAAQPGRLFLRLQFPLLSATMKKQASRVPECFKRARAGLHCEVYLQNGRIQV